MVTHITDKSAEVRQAAVYGCGVLGMHGGDVFSGKCILMLGHFFIRCKQHDNHFNSSAFAAGVITIY